MVKTTYALTLFAAMSLAAPLPSAGNVATSVGHMRRDGSGNLVGAGTADGAVNEMVKGLATPESDHQAGQDDMGKKAAEIKAADQKKKNMAAHSPLEDVPLIGSLLRPVPLKRDHEARSLTGDLSNLPLLGKLFGGNQNHPANSPDQKGGGQKVDMRRSHTETDFPQNYGQNHGQNYGQNAGQNADQNAGQNEGQNEGQNYLQNYGQNHGQNEGQNSAQNYGQNHGQNEGQNMEKREKPAGQPDSLGALWLLNKLTSGGPENISHKRNEQPTSPEGFVPTRRDSGDGGEISDAVTAALESNVDRISDAADAAAPARRDLLTDLTSDLSKGEDAPQPGQSKSDPQSDKDDKDGKDKDDKKNDPLTQLGLSGLFDGSNHHGLGLLPMGRRDVHENKARGGAPIQGSDLPSVLFSGGLLGKLAKTLTPGGGAGAGGQ